MVGYYHSKETFGTVDGPGIRYVLFLAGCSLGCAFCHNPDSWARGEQLISVVEVLAELEEYQNFYKSSGGGITVSGGEPLRQPEFVAALFRACRERAIHTVLDTSGFCPQSAIAPVLQYTDQVLFSLKAADPQVHRYLTNGESADILKNLGEIAGQKPVTLRYVVIPGINDRESDIDQLITVIQNCRGEIKVDLLGYHTMGRYKWKELGMAYKLADVPPATPDDVMRVRARLMVAGINMQYEISSKKGNRT